MRPCIFINGEEGVASEAAELVRVEPGSAGRPRSGGGDVGVAEVLVVVVEVAVAGGTGGSVDGSR